MMKKLHFLKEKILLMCFLLSTLMGFAQTMATFNFNGKNLFPVGGQNPSYTLNYYNANNSIGTARYDRIGFWSGNHWTYTKTENTYYELSISTIGYSNINFSFDGELSFSGWSRGTWNVYLDHGTGYNFIGKVELENIISSDSETFDIVLPPEVNNKSLVKIKLVANDLWDVLNNIQQLRLDNIRLTSNTAKIAVDGKNTIDVWTNIVEGATAEAYRGTYFGMLITNPISPNPAFVDRNFKVTNSGNTDLNISGMSFIGNAPADFSIVSALPITVPANGGSAEFIIRFNPSEDGVRNALLNIISNGAPSPFTFFVEGRGSACATTIKAFKWNTIGDQFNDLDDNLFTISGTTDAISGTSQLQSHSPFESTILYKDDDTAFKLYKSDNHSWYISDNSVAGKSVSFGSLNVSQDKGPLISFNLAAISKGTGSGFNFNSNDYITVEVLKPGTTNEWSKEVKINGGGSVASSRYDFEGGSTVDVQYAGTGVNNYVVEKTNSGTKPTRYSQIIIRLPSDDFSNLVFRITGKTENLNKLWLIDDIMVSSENAIFKSFTGIGATGWQQGTEDVAVPNIQEKAIIDVSYDTAIKGDFTACECVVNNGSTLTINTGNTVTLENRLDNSLGGQVVVKNDANLIQKNDLAVNAGVITVHRTAPMKKNNYTYWGSPVTGRKLQDFSPGTTSYRFYEYIESTNLFQTVPWGNNFIPGRGYAIMAPSNYTLNTKQDFDGAFVGIPNNGTNYQDTPSSTLPLMFPASLTAGTDQGYNLVGNPYPSNIDFEKLHADNSSVIYNTAYFWTNVDPNRAGSTNGNTGYAGNAYAIYNGVGGIAATGPATGPGGTSPTPTQFIKVGQGFIVKAKNEGSLTFKNSIRNATGSSAFFSKGAASDRDRFWVKLTTPAQDVNTVLIGYVPNATDDFEWDYDAPLFSIGSDSFYSMLGEEKLGIQGRTYPLNTADVVRLGTKHFEDGIYTIGLGDKEGIFAGSQAIYLNDKQTGTITNLSEGDYGFTANVGESQNRFELIYKPLIVLVTDSTVKEGFIVYRDQDHFIIQSPKVINEVEVYDSVGKLIKVLNTSTKKVVVDGAFLTKGMYVIRIKTIDGQVTNKKILK